MKTIEKILAISVGVAFVLKLNGISIGSMILITTLGSLAMLYSYFGLSLYSDEEIGIHELKDFLQKRRSLHNKISIETSASYSISILLVGILFNLQHWPGGPIMLNVGLIATLCVSIIVIFKQRKDPDNNVLKNMLVRLGIIGSSGVVVFIVTQYFTK